MRVVAALLLLAAAPLAAQGSGPPPRLANSQLPDPAQEAAARGVMDQIRCLVCAGQSVGDSDAQMAGDMRALIRERIAAGESPDAVRGWLIDRYGSVITYAPPLSPASALLWALPALALAGGLWFARGSFRRRRRS